MTSSTPVRSGATRHEVIEKGERDLVMTYIEEIDKFPVLTDAEALQLGRDKELGEKADWFRMDRNGLSEAERRERMERVASGLLARKRLIEANLRLVVSIGRRYQGYGLGMLALIDAGNRGLARAIDKFDGTSEQLTRRSPEAVEEDELSGNTFATFASSWIRAAIHRALDVIEEPRIPRYGEAENNVTVRQLNDLIDELPSRLGREPTVEEIANDLGFTAARARRYASSLIMSLDMDPNEGDSESTRRLMRSVD